MDLKEDFVFQTFESKSSESKSESVKTGLYSPDSSPSPDSSTTSLKTAKFPRQVVLSSREIVARDFVQFFTK